MSPVSRMTTPEHAGLVAMIEDSDFAICDWCGRPLEIDPTTGVLVHSLDQGHMVVYSREDHGKEWVGRILAMGNGKRTAAAAAIWALLDLGRLLYPDDAQTIIERSAALIDELDENTGR